MLLENAVTYTSFSVTADALHSFDSKDQKKIWNLTKLTRKNTLKKIDTVFKMGLDRLFILPKKIFGSL